MPVRCSFCHAPRHRCLDRRQVRQLLHQLRLRQRPQRQCPLCSGISCRIQRQWQSRLRSPDRMQSSVSGHIQVRHRFQGQCPPNHKHQHQHIDIHLGVVQICPQQAAVLTQQLWDHVRTSCQTISGLQHGAHEIVSGEIFLCLRMRTCHHTIAQYEDLPSHNCTV